MQGTRFKNPLAESNRTLKRPDPCILVIFGATGDLTARKLVPSLFALAKSGRLPAHFACVGVARKDKSHDQFRDEMQEAVKNFGQYDKALWDSFKDSIFYHRSEFHEEEGFDSLRMFLKKLDNQLGTRGNRVFYLATQPKFFPKIIEKLGSHALLYDVDTVSDKWSRVVIEKPFGHDLESSITLQKEITQSLDESQIYRIDHYLGKETVQNILVFRFSNPIFETIWNQSHVDHVQITVSEDIGIGRRGSFFEEAGIMRDIVQNHMMQLLSLIAMEPPKSLEADDIRDEKVKVLESIRPLDPMRVVRGQYGKGIIHTEEVAGYRQEDHVAKDSNVETFVALELFIDNWRWSGVPFYLRAGKRLPKRATEIAIAFKSPPGFLFKDHSPVIDQNILVIRIQPDEGIALRMNCKIPGMTSPVEPVKMDFRYGEYFGTGSPDAYERLIIDCMAADNTLFARIDEVKASWQLLSPLFEIWKANPADSFPNYRAGMWGPSASEQLIQSTGRCWRLL